MKKRVLSLVLAVLMLVVALPLMALPAMASETPTPTYEAADYNALYVQSGLVFGFDFFTTNSHWGGEGYTADLSVDAKKNATAAYTDTVAMLNSFSYRKSATNIKLDLNDRTKAETVAIGDGYLNMSGIHQLLVGQVDIAMGDAYNGSTVELVMTPGTTGTKGQFPVLNDHRFIGEIKDGKYQYSSFGLQNTSAPLVSAPSYNGAAVGLTLGSLGTYVYQMQRPEDTQSFYNFNYEKQGIVKPADVTANESSNFHVGFAATYEGDAVVAITPIASTALSFYQNKPTVVEFEGKKYIVGSVERASTPEGIGEGQPFYHDPATDPGMIVVHRNGETIFRDDAVRYHNNDKSSATYLRLWGQGPNTSMYAGRFYGRVLTADEMAINHAVDLMKWFRLDITDYLSLGNADRVLLAKDLAAYDLLSDRDAVATALLDSYNKIAYDGLLEGLTEGTHAYTATVAFLTVAKQYHLSIAEVKLLPEAERAEIYAAVTAAASLPGLHTQASLQATLDEAFDAILARYIGDVPEYDYKDIYVKQDSLKVAIDFFDAKATDEPVYVGVSYDNWPELYNTYTANWQALGFASKSEAEYAAKDDRDEIVRPNTWEDMLDKYLWKGTNKDLTPLDIADRYYRHDNIRTFGDGYLNCTLNNSIVLPIKDDTTDLTYQVVGKIMGGNWQVRGFRPTFTNSAGGLSVATIAYNAFTVSGTEAAPKTNEAGLASISFPSAERPTVPMTNSVDFTAVVDKAHGGDLGHYYKYEWDATAAKWVVNEVSDPAEANYGPVVYAGKMNLTLYGNGAKMYELDKHYSPNAPDSLGNAGSNIYYAIRFYTCTLTADEIKQNHFADLAGLYDLDLSAYYRLTAEQRADLHHALRSVELGTEADLVKAYYRDVLCDVYYTLAVETEAAAKVIELAKEYLLNIDNILELSPRSRERVYLALANDPLVIEGVDWHPAILQSKLEGIIKSVQEEYFAESVSHRVIDLEGYQVNLTGDVPGMRAVFRMDDTLLERLRLAYPANGIEMTIGVMLLPATAGEVALTVENGNVVLPEEVLGSVIAYDAGGFTDKAIADENGSSYVLEYYPDAENVDTAVAFVGFLCIQLPGEEPIITYETYDAGNIAKGNAFSLVDLSRYVKRTKGMAHKNIQALLNATDDAEDISLRIGNSDLCDYVIYKTAQNMHLIDTVQDIVYSYAGVRLRVAEIGEIGQYENVFYLGAMDTVHTESALYGIQAYGNSFGVWFNDIANADAAIEKLEELFEFTAAAEGHTYHLTAGTEYTFRAR